MKSKCPGRGVLKCSGRGVNGGTSVYGQKEFPLEGEYYGLTLDGEHYGLTHEGSVNNNKSSAIWSPALVINVET